MITFDIKVPLGIEIQTFKTAVHTLANELVSTQNLSLFYQLQELKLHRGSTQNKDLYSISYKSIINPDMQTGEINENSTIGDNFDYLDRFVYIYAEKLQ